MPLRAASILTLILLAASLSRLDAVAPAVVAGDSFTLFLRADGTVLGAGANESGQLGDGVETGHSTPQPVPGLRGVQAMAAGTGHSLFLKTDGTVWATGQGVHGQLGDGTVENRNTARPVPGLTGVLAIAAGGYHSLFLKTDGTVWAAGLNDAGQLGDGTTTARRVPVRVLEGVKGVAAESGSSFFLKADGTVMATGHNLSGQLGDGTTVDRQTPVAVEGLTHVKSIAPGRGHTLFLTVDGTVFATGSNDFGALADTGHLSRTRPARVRDGVRAIAAGNQLSFLLGTDGILAGAGRNSVGQLGDGTTTDRPAPVGLATGVESVATGLSHTCFLKADGTVWTTGYNFNGQLGDGRTGHSPHPVPIPGLTGVQAVTSEGNHSLFLRTDGTVLGTGFNLYGELGDGSKIMRYSPVSCAISGVRSAAVGGLGSIFIKTDGSVYASGGYLFSSSGQLVTKPVPVPGVGAARMAGGSSHALFLLEAGTVLGMGSNGSGQLGDGTTFFQRTSPVRAAGLEGVASLAAGREHSLFLLDNGTVMACGSNGEGQLGKPYPSDRTGGGGPRRASPLAVPGLDGITAVAAAGWHSLFLKSDATVLAAGWNSFGQLGLGAGEREGYGPWPVPGLTGVKAVSAGLIHSLFLKSDGTVHAVGNNSKGQLGDGTFTGRNIPAPVPGLEDIQAVAAGGECSLFLKRDGSVLACGSNEYGAAGLGVFNRSTAVEVAGLGRDPGAAWQRDQFGELAADPAVSGWLSDPDGDDVVNLLERAFNLPALQSGRAVLDPGAGNEAAGRAGLPWVTLVPKPQGPVLAVHYVRLKTAAGAGTEAHGGLVYTPEFCTAPDGGSGGGEGRGWTAATGPETVVAIDDHWERVTVEDTGGGGGGGSGARFARVRVGGRG